MTSKEIRLSFLDYFTKEGHFIAESAPIVIKNDPTLMFTNAGMNQWKGIILGNEPIVHARVADIQKCLRVSGKHNDLEEVGQDTYHHTMFEMMGNWSFGNYFKAEAIQFAWNYLIQVLRLDPADLYATVYEGSTEDNIGADIEAFDIWKCFLPQDHILYGNRHDNFWEMGETGPCGPCSEIHIDCRTRAEKEITSGAQLVNKDHPQVIEIWNLVFMQYNRKTDGSLEVLPHKIIDTGMGFERLVRVVQQKQSNYDTDLFQPMIQRITQICNEGYAAVHGKILRYGESSAADIAIRVIADHIRTIAFAIVDGQLPSNDKAGYVIRRILRRATRFAYSFLEQKQPFLYLLVPQLVEDMGDFYPQLVEQQENVSKIIKAEEMVFLHTLDKGLQLLDNLIDQARKQHSNAISGKDVFVLKDTYGFPLDLTELILRERGYTTDLQEFNVALEEQKQRGRDANKQEYGDWVEVLANASSSFVGYTQEQCQTQIIKYRSIQTKGEILYQLVLTQTPLYAEMGGEVGDTGELIDELNQSYAIVNTLKENGTIIHLLKTLPQNVNATFTIKVDAERRLAIERNHSATHILHYALRQVLGEHVEQKGSFVCDAYLRFDFSHFQKVTPEELKKVELIANRFIRQNVSLDEMIDVPIEKAKEMGAMALFSEKYGERVRVIKFGPSIELCGGCHVQNTGMIGTIRITNETSVATGIRRIEAVTAQYADELYYRQQDLIEQCKISLNAPQNILNAIQKILDENKELKTYVEQCKTERAKQLHDQLFRQKEKIGELSLCQLVGEYEAALVRDVALLFKNKYDSDAMPFAFVATTVEKGKPSICLYVNSSMVARGNNAGKMIKEAARFIGGGGGGQTNMATAGGKNIEGLKEALDFIRKNLQ